MGNCISNKQEPRDRIEGYRIVKSLPSCGLKRLHKIERDDGNVFVMKVHDRRVSGSKERARREFEMLQSLDSHWVIKAYVAFEIGGGYGFIMEHFGDRDLLQHINDIPPGEEESREYFHQMVKAVSYLHTMGVAHLDLKLENILVDSVSGKIKLCDFEHAVKRRINNRIRGTIYYLPPEMLTTELEYRTKPVDIWCLGVCLHFMITNRYPFESQTVEALKTEMLTRSIDYDKLPLTALGSSLLVRMLEFEPSDRPKIEDVIIHPWLAVERRCSMDSFA